MIGRKRAGKNHKREGGGRTPASMAERRRQEGNELVQPDLNSQAAINAAIGSSSPDSGASGCESGSAGDSGGSSSSSDGGGGGCDGGGSNG